MVSERHSIWSGLTLADPTDPRLVPSIEIPSGADTKIKLNLYKLFGRKWTEAQKVVDYELPELIAERLVFVLLSDFNDPYRKSHYIDILSQKLSGMGVGGFANICTICKIFNVAEVAVPGKHIIVVVSERTHRIFKSAPNLGIGDVTGLLWIDRECAIDVKTISHQIKMKTMYDSPKVIPAAISSIQGLEIVRLDTLEASVAQMKCTICKESLRNTYVVESEELVHEFIVIRLPCSHFCHGDCIAQWLERIRLCPLCKFPIGILGKPSKSSPVLHWPTLLMSAVGLLTATLVPRLLNRS